MSAKRSQAKISENKPSVVAAASPTRSSARLRGVKVDIDLNALDELEKRKRSSRSRSNTPAKVATTPAKEPLNAIEESEDGVKTGQKRKSDEFVESPVTAKKIDFDESYDSTKNTTPTSVRRSTRSVVASGTPTIDNFFKAPASSKTTPLKAISDEEPEKTANRSDSPEIMEVDEAEQSPPTKTTTTPIIEAVESPSKKTLNEVESSSTSKNNSPVKPVQVEEEVSSEDEEISKFSPRKTRSSTQKSNDETPKQPIQTTQASTNTPTIVNDESPTSFKESLTPKTAESPTSKTNSPLKNEEKVEVEVVVLSDSAKSEVGSNESVDGDGEDFKEKRMDEEIGEEKDQTFNMEKLEKRKRSSRSSSNTPAKTASTPAKVATTPVKEPLNAIEESEDGVKTVQKRKSDEFVESPVTAKKIDFDESYDSTKNTTPISVRRSTRSAVASGTPTIDNFFKAPAKTTPLKAISDDEPEKTADCSDEPEKTANRSDSPEIMEVDEAEQSPPTKTTTTPIIEAVESPSKKTLNEVESSSTSKNNSPMKPVQVEEEEVSSEDEEISKFSPRKTRSSTQKSNDETPKQPIQTTQASKNTPTIVNDESSTSSEDVADSNESVDGDSDEEFQEKIMDEEENMDEENEEEILDEENEKMGLDVDDEGEKMGLDVEKNEKNGLDHDEGEKIGLDDEEEDLDDDEKLEDEEEIDWEASNSSGGGDDDSVEELDLEDPKIVQKRRAEKYGKSLVDDEFFKLAEMNEFLEQQDRLEAKRQLGKFDGADEMMARMSEFEGENLKPRGWALSGEVTGVERDRDEILNDYVDVDYRTVPPPEITPEVTDRIEAIIKQRIRDKNFDDPIRVKRKDESLVVSGSRHKEGLLEDAVRKSLAEVYEEEFKAKQRDDQEEHAPDMDEEDLGIKKEMDSLFERLDALFHYQYAPPPVMPEVKIVKNVASFRREEVGPLASAEPNVNLLAPEEVRRRAKFLPKAKDERTETDRKRERRHKKKKQKVLAGKGLLNGGTGTKNATAVVDLASKNEKMPETSSINVKKSVKKLNGEGGSKKPKKSKKSLRNELHKAGGGKLKKQSVS